MPITLGPGNFYINGESAGQVVTWTADERFLSCTLPTRWPPRWPTERVTAYTGDEYGSMDESAGASVDDLIDDIDAVLDSYRESRDGLRG